LIRPNLALKSRRDERRCDLSNYEMKFGAGDGNRTHDIQLGKLSFYH
jgi:hypothetical protein